MQGQAGSMRNSLNSMFRQQQAANQKARQDAKNKKYGMMSAVFGAVAGPALGALGDNLAKKLVHTGSGGNPIGGSIFSQAAGNIQGGYQGFNPQQAFRNFYGGGNFGNTLGGGYLDPNGVSVPENISGVPCFENSVNYDVRNMLQGSR